MKRQFFQSSESFRVLQFQMTFYFLYLVSDSDKTLLVFELTTYFEMVNIFSEPELFLVNDFEFKENENRTRFMRGKKIITKDKFGSSKLCADAVSVLILDEPVKKGFDSLSPFWKK